MSNSNLMTDLQLAVTSIGKTWKKEKLHNERVSRARLNQLRTPFRQQSIKEAAFEVMEEAIDKASGGGRYLTNARQIMYAARPFVLENTEGKLWKKSEYFTQTILKDYIEEHEGEEAIANIVWDARGHLTEPFTKKIIPLGGAAVIDYIADWKSDFDTFELPKQPIRINTIGPKNRFKNILFIEKEGFDVILEASGIANKYDLAIMSTKGIPVAAACKLANEMSSTGVKIFVLHDFDLAGFKIMQTLKKGTRLSEGVPVIDLGFRMADIQNLQSEPVTYNQRTDPRIYLRKCGATKEEQDFLVNPNSYDRKSWEGKRVELNAMTSDQFIAWLEKKLTEQGIQKIIPDKEVLRESYQRAAFRVYIKSELEQLKEDYLPEDIDVPEDLSGEVKKHITENPKLSWDEAVYQIADKKEGGGEFV